jgi:hypothetical protein
MAALEILEIPCYHMQTMMADMEVQVGLWEEARLGRGDWERIFDGFDSTVDWPAAYHYRELMDVYPEAKVLLSVRDAEGWARSMFDTIWQVYFGESLMHHLCQARRLVDPAFERWYDLMVSMTWANTGPFARDEIQNLMASMETWNDEVRATVPAERLLEWHPKDGWEPLCNFLEVDVPDQDLPQVWDTAAFKAGITGAALTAVNSYWDSQQAAAA